MISNVLFRGKNDCGSWVYGSLIQADEYCCILEEESKVHPMYWPYLDPDLGTFDGKATPVDPETVSQYTGVNDKNGKKIFGGDIIKIDENVKNMFNSVDGEVVYVGGMFKINNIHRESILDSLYSIIDIHFVLRGEVCGNKWDNPELLEGKKNE